MAQHAKPNVMGHSEFLRAQFTAKSMLETIKPSSNRFSIHDIRYVLSAHRQTVIGDR
jgi:hypothetical protein